MITGKLSSLAESPYTHEKLMPVLKLLQEMDFSQYTGGRHELGNGSFFFLNEFETKEAENCFWEAHRKYIDIHFILDGQEKIAFDHIDRQSVETEYDPEKDAVFLEGELHSEMTMNPGDVMICLPEDSHMTGLVAGHKQKVRKVVLKVEI